LISELNRNDKAFAILDLTYYIQSLTARNLKRHAIGDQSGDVLGITMPLSSDWEPILKEFFESGFISSPEYKAIISKHMGKSALRMIQGL
jgi:hypothetical protein